MVNSLSSATPEPLDVPGDESCTAQSMPLTILIADDSEINRRILQKLLARLGYEPLVAPSGEKVLEMMGVHQVDLILMDINMDGMSGVETTTRLREKEGHDSPASYVVAVTADMPASLQVECLQAGMNDWLLKPLSSRTMQGVIHSAWEHRQARQEQADSGASEESRGFRQENTQDAASGAQESDPEVDTLDCTRFDMLMDLTDREVPLMRQLFGMFEKSLTEKFVTIREKIEQDDSVAAAKAAHAIKSSSLEIGAAKLRELAERAENAAREGELDKCRELAESGPDMLELFQRRFETAVKQSDNS